MPISLQHLWRKWLKKSNTFTHTVSGKNQVLCVGGACYEYKDGEIGEKMFDCPKPTVEREESLKKEFEKCIGNKGRVCPKCGGFMEQKGQKYVCTNSHKDEPDSHCRSPQQLASAEECSCPCHDSGDCGRCGCHIVDEVAMDQIGPLKQFADAMYMLTEWHPDYPKNKKAVIETVMSMAHDVLYPSKPSHD